MADKNDTGLSGRRVSARTPLWTNPYALAAGGVTAVALGAGGMFYALNTPAPQDAPAATLPTSEPSEFQTGQSDRWREIEQGEPAPTFSGPSEAELAAIARAQALEGRVSELEEALANAKAQVITETVVDDTGLAELRGQIATINQELEGVRTDNAKLRGDNVRLAAELEGAKLQLSQNDEEARRQAELQRRREEAAALDRQKINSPISGGGSRSSSAAENGETDYTGDEAFIRAGRDKLTAQKSRVIAAPSNTITQGTIIEATLTTGINSNHSGTITSTVAYDVWSFDLSNVLIPRGSQIFGRYQSGAAIGQRRVLVAWDRLVTPDGQVVDLDAYGGDRLGRSGLTGRVNNRFFERFGSAALISVIGAIPSLLADDDDDSAEADAVEAVSSNTTNAVTSLIEDYINIAPTITVEHGDIVTVMVNNDLEFF